MALKAPLNLKWQIDLFMIRVAEGAAVFLHYQFSSSSLSINGRQTMNGDVHLSDLLRGAS